MNKILTKLLTFSVGLAMAIGVGVALKGNETRGARAADVTTSWTATSGALGSKIGSGTFNTKITGSSTTQQWSYIRELKKGESYSGWTNNCIQLGKNGGVENLTLSTSNITGTIKSVSIECASYQGKHNVSITVGDTTYLTSTATSSWETVSAKSGTGTSSGQIVISFTGGTRALYIKSLSVTYSAPSDYITDLAVSPSTALVKDEDELIDTSIFTISGRKNGGSISTLASSDYVFQGVGTGSGSTFSVLSTTNYVANATRIQWKAKYPTTGGGSTYSYAGIELTVNVELVEYTKVTDLSTLAAGEKYLIVREERSKALGGVSSSLGVPKSVTIENNKITSKANKGDAVEYLLGGSSGAWTFFGDDVYLSYSGSSNYLLTSDTASSNNQKWTTTMDSNGVLTISNNALTTRNLQYNYNQGTDRFACYTSTQESVSLYHKVILEPSVTVISSKSGYVGEEDVTLEATAKNFTPTSWSWASLNETVAEVSGSTSIGTLTLKAAGSTTITVTASNASVTKNASCALTVTTAPTGIQVKVGSVIIDDDYVFEDYEGKYKIPTVNIIPAEAVQTYTLSVYSETTTGAFTISNNRINFVKPGTGVVRITSTIKPSLTKDINVSCLEDTYTEDSLTYTGEPATQTYGEAFNAEGLSFAITKASGVKEVNLNELTFSPTTMAFETTVVEATHADSGQTIEIPVEVEQPLTAEQALELIKTDYSSTDSTDYFYVKAFIKKMVDVGGYYIYLVDDIVAEKEKEDDDCLIAYKSSKPSTPAGVDYDDDIYPNDIVVVKGKLGKYGDLSEIKGTSIVEWYPEDVELVSSIEEDTLIVNSDFSYNGTLTADYTLRDDMTVSTDAVTFSENYNMSVVGDYEITVSWESDIYQDPISCTYTLHVVYATITSIEVTPSTSNIAFNDSFDLDELTVTVNANANPNFTWSIISAKDKDNNNMLLGTDYTYNSSTHVIGSFEKAGTITAKATSTVDSNIYDDFELFINGEPEIVLDKETIYGIANAADNTISVSSYLNMTAPYEYEWKITSGSDVASATDGSEKSTISFLKEGTAQISVTVTDANELTATATAQINSLQSINEVRYDETIVYPDQRYYEKVTSTAGITDGDYLLVYEDGNVAFNGGLETLDATENSVAVEITNGRIESSTTVDAATFTIDIDEKVAANSTLKSSSGLYIGNDADSNTLKSSAETEYTNTFSIDNDGNVTVFASGGSYLRYNSASNQLRFRYYKSSSYTAQKAIQLYKQINIPGETIIIPHYYSNINYNAQKAVLEYAAEFNSVISKVCDAQGATDLETLTSKWNDLADTYVNWFNEGDKDLTEDEITVAKSLFKYADAVDKKDDPTADALQDMLAKYEYVLKRYKTLSDFLHNDPGTNRDPVKRSATFSLFNLSHASSSVLIISTLTSIVAIASFAGYFYYKKKKDN